MGRRFYLYRLIFPNGKLYFGLTSNKSVRFVQHRYFANNGSKRPVAIAMRKHGLPRYDIVCIGTRDYITDLEAKAIIAFKTNINKFGYNRMIGPSHSEETRAAMSAAKKGKTHKGHPSPMKGKKRPPRSPEWSAKIAAGLKGKRKGMKGKPHSAEAKVKMRNAALGRKAWNKGVKRTPTERAAIKAGLANSEAAAIARQKLIERNKRGGKRIVHINIGHHPDA